MDEFETVQIECRAYDLGHREGLRTALRDLAERAIRQAQRSAKTANSEDADDDDRNEHAADCRLAASLAALATR